MDYNQLFAISSAGMTLQRSRVEVATINLTNAHTIQAAGTRPWQPLRVVAQSVPLRQSAGAGARFATLVDSGLKQVPEVRIEAISQAPRLVHQPDHPLADAQGNIAYPDVDDAAQMISLLDASNSYKANLMALNMGRALVMKTLDIGNAS